jgi:hypothetical protein
MDTPLERAEVKCEKLESDLRKSPDFQLYLLTESRRDRARMESVLMEIPQFALWRTLTRSVRSARRRSLVSVKHSRDSRSPGAGRFSLRTSRNDFVSPSVACPKVLYSTIAKNISVLIGKQSLAHRRSGGGGARQDPPSHKAAPSIEQRPGAIGEAAPEKGITTVQCAERRAGPATPLRS